MKAFVLVPHQDDEINLVGNILDRITAEYETYVIYSSLDSDLDKGQIRKNEAYHSCDMFGIDSKHIIFLEYSDNSNKRKEHFFTNGDRSIVVRLKELILKYKPDIIFATDFDYHSDHRMLSLAFDEAMGNVMKENPGYIPRILKGFCYETAYYGPEDYKASNPGMSLSPFKTMSNCSLEWDRRIRILSVEKPGMIWKKKAYKALKCHESQYAVLHARSIINSDNVFWQRRTDNLMLSASISADSGDVSKLNDFKIIDTDDIITIEPREIDYSKGIWHSDEKSCKIHVSWNQKVKLNQIVLHGNPGKDIDTNLNIEIISKEVGTIAKSSTVRAYGRDTKIEFGEIETDNLDISLTSDEGPIELSEIEAFLGDLPIEILKDEQSGSLEGNNVFMDLVDGIGYNCIVFVTRLKRKIKNIQRKR